MLFFWHNYFAVRALSGPTSMPLRPSGRPRSNHNMGGEKGFSGTFVLARLTGIESALCQSYAKYFHFESKSKLNEKIFSF